MINDNSLVINDELHINLSDRSIMNIENKTLIKLRPKPFRVLLYLHNHNGRCVSKDELFSECWNGAIVSDQSLTNTISTLRKSLKTIGIKKTKLTTVSKAGYLLEKISNEELPEPHLPTETSLASEIQEDDTIAAAIDGATSEVSVPVEVIDNQELANKPHETLVYLKKLFMLMLAISSLSLIRGCYNTNNINKNMTQRLVSTENISYNLVDHTGMLDLDSMEGIIRVSSYKNCRARHIDITVTKNGEGVFETDFSIVYKNKAHNYLHSYKIKNDSSEVRILQISKILSLCKLSF
ncbi:transcriptional regulator [Vibrio chagasii]|uniref:transcriptional regulator n=1 Tax=Vibrio chagasii TaxID=170679 RepID=UPI0022842234|nr:winged helix-turn-helix domain-containing protein [Vibrio chagasii]MCY9825497.1 winged helix-turn-helix domain-containing protein [Vibrio chagasii]